MVNLITNAVKYNRDNGNVNIIIAINQNSLGRVVIGDSGGRIPKGWPGGFFGHLSVAVKK
jgi:signal transduction histidine kinase